jgi:hypothetical protein
VASAVGGAALLAGGLFAGAAFVSAQEPSPTPGVEQQAPSDDGTTTPKSREECEKDGTSGSGTSSGVRGRSADDSRYF